MVGHPRLSLPRVRRDGGPLHRPRSRSRPVGEPRGNQDADRWIRPMPMVAGLASDFCRNPAVQPPPRVCPHAGRSWKTRPRIARGRRRRAGAHHPRVFAATPSHPAATEHHPPGERSTETSLRRSKARVNASGPQLDRHRASALGACEASRSDRGARLSALRRDAREARTGNARLSRVDRLRSRERTQIGVAARDRSSFLSRHAAPVPSTGRQPGVAARITSSTEGAPPRGVHVSHQTPVPPRRGSASSRLCPWAYAQGLERAARRAL